MKPSSRTVFVTWKPISLRYRNGIIVHYNITYYSAKWNQNMTIQVNSNATSVTLSELIPFTTYNITIRAATIIGFGPPSIDATTTLIAGEL